MPAWHVSVGPTAQLVFAFDVCFLYLLHSHPFHTLFICFHGKLCFTKFSHLNMSQQSLHFEFQIHFHHPPAYSLFWISILISSSSHMLTFFSLFFHSVLFLSSSFISSCKTCLDLSIFDFPFYHCLLHARGHKREFDRCHWWESVFRRV